MAEQDIFVTSLQGGLNDTDNPSAIQPDQCTTANNVEWFHSSLGERRNGCDPLSLTNSTLTAEAVIGHISQWFSSNIISVPEFWAVGITAGVSSTWAKRTGGNWSPVVPADAAVNTAPNIYGIVSQTGPSSLSPLGKLFFAYPSAVDRLHVWDPNNGATLRRTGLAQPAAPTAADEGVGTYSGVRYFRIRYSREAGVGNEVTIQSEPSLAVTFTPSGTGAGATITRPVLLGEGEQFWTLEASLDNVNFYVLQTQAIGTTTTIDATPYATGYASQGPLSELIGSYLLQPSARYLAVDGDRLLLAGHWTDPSRMSSVWWTPVFNDPGVGNDERLPLQVNNTRSLDNFDGGPITGITSGLNGVWYAFKWNHIYQFTRTGDVTNAYDVLTISTKRGALPGSIFPGMDEYGSPCIYFLDPLMGPSRIGGMGLQVITGLRTTWGRVNLSAANIISRGVYYPYKQQAHWWVAVDGSDTPNLKLVLQINQLQAVGGNAISRGWSLATGRIAQAYSATTFTEVRTVGGFQVLTELPFIGLTSPDFIQRCDVDTTDAGIAYTATIVSGPKFFAGILNKWGAMTATLLASISATGRVAIQFIRDFGLETTTVTAPLAATASETLTFQPLDNLDMSGARAIQVGFSDPTGPNPSTGNTTVTWAAETTPAADREWEAVAWSPTLSLFAAVAFDGTKKAMSSPDGVTWTEHNAADDQFSVFNEWWDVIWCAGTVNKFISVGGTAGTTDWAQFSSNGTSWLPSTSGTPQTTWKSLAFSTAASRAVAVADSGATRVMYSDDGGATWTGASAAEANGWEGIAWSPTLSLFVAVANTGTHRVMTSTDGVTWAAQTAAEANSWQSVTWAAALSLFVAVSIDGTHRVMTSPDGVTWTAQTAAAANPWIKVTWAQELGSLLAVSTSGTNRTMQSSDGVTWTAFVAAAQNEWHGITWSPALGSFVAVAGKANEGTAGKQAMLGVTEITPFLPAQWQLHRLDIKPRFEERA